MSDDAIRKLDIHAKNARVHAERVWERMRAAPGLARSETYGGFWIAARHKDLKAALQNHAAFVSGRGITLPEARTRSRHIPSETDQPLHKEYRGVMAPTLAPDKVAALAPAVGEIVRELLDRLGGATRADLFSAFARPLPVYVMLQFLGLPRRDGEVIDRLVDELHEEVATGVVTGAGAKLTQYAEDVIADRERAGAGAGDDFVAAVLRGQVDGRPLSFDEKANMVRQVLIGAFDTTSLTLASGLWWLARHPHDAQRLRDEPALMNTAVEEMVRYASASTYLRRTVACDSELGGAQLREGEHVLLAFGAANRDPDVFEAPDQLVLDRSPKHHLGFGLGVHRCIGSHLAKLQISLALRETLARYELRPDPDGEVRFSSGLGQGLVSLPLLLTPRQ